MSSDCVNCGDDAPNAIVRLNGCDCVKHGLRGMKRLIESGDRAEDAEIIRRRTACRSCPYKTREKIGDVCMKDGLALHLRTAVGSYECENWCDG